MTASRPSCRAGAQKLIARRFNGGKAKETSAFFLPKGEWIDEEGTVYQGQEQIEGVLKEYFEKFPEARMALESGVGPARRSGGHRRGRGRCTAARRGGEAIIRYIAVYAKTENGWRIASVRTLPDDPARRRMTTSSRWAGWWATGSTKVRGWW